MTGLGTRQPSRLLALLGGGLLIAVTAWWALVFLRAASIGIVSAREALACAVTSSVLCDLAMSLCGRSHPLGIAWYSPTGLWLAVALLSAAALIHRDRA